MKTLIKLKALVTLMIAIIISFSTSCQEALEIEESNLNVNKVSLKQSKGIAPNSTLETDLFAYYAKSEITSMNEQKKELLKEVKKGNKNAEIEIKKIAVKEKKLANSIKINASILKNDLVSFKIGPRPPCPPRDGGICANDWLQSIVLSPVFKNLTIKAYNGKKLVGSLDKSPYAIDKNGYQAYHFNWLNGEKYSGAITSIIVTRTDLKGNIETYTF